MSKNVVQPEKSQTVCWMRVARWISKATCAKVHVCAHAPTPISTRTNTHACTHPSFLSLFLSLSHSHTHTHTHTDICNTYCFSTVRVVSWTRLNVTLYVYCMSSNTLNYLPHIRENRLPLPFSTPKMDGAVFFLMLATTSLVCRTGQRSLCVSRNRLIERQCAKLKFLISGYHDTLYYTQPQLGWTFYIIKYCLIFGTTRRVGYCLCFHLVFYQ
jgi:hypothetical protein